MMADARRKAPVTPTQGTMERTYRRARDSAGDALESARETAHDAGKRVRREVDANPFALLAGGVAIGALAGAFIPVTRREASLIGPTGKRLTDSARDAIEAAKDTGKAELGNLGISRSAAQDQVGKLIGGVLQALASAGEAAADAAKK